MIRLRGGTKKNPGQAATKSVFKRGCYYFLWLDPTAFDNSHNDGIRWSPSGLRKPSNPLIKRPLAPYDDIDPCHGLIACRQLSGLLTTPTALIQPQTTMEEMGEFSPILPFLINLMTTTFYNHFCSARIRLFMTGIAATNTTGSRFMRKLYFPLPKGVDHRTRLWCIIWSSLIQWYTTRKDIDYTAIKWVKGVCDDSRRWVGIIYLTHTPQIASITELQNLPSRAGDITLEHQKTKNNQPKGWNTPREYMAWEGHTHHGMQDHVSSTIHLHRNKNGGTTGVDRSSILISTSSH